MSTKYTTIKIAATWGDGQLLYCKGHFPALDFITACQEYVHHQWSEDATLVIASHEVQQGYARNIPCAPNNPDCEWAYTINFCKQGRGAYPITYIEM